MNTNIQLCGRFVSDPVRGALAYVWAQQGYVYGSDGYRMHRAPTTEPDGAFTAEGQRVVLATSLSPPEFSRIIPAAPPCTIDLTSRAVGEIRVLLTVLSSKAKLVSISFAAEARLTIEAKRGPTVVLGTDWLTTPAKELSLNLRYLGDALDLPGASDGVTLRYTDARSPVRIDVNDHTHVILPMRI